MRRDDLLAQPLQRRSPGLASRVLFVTGGAMVEEVRAFLEETGAPVVEKPFAPVQIVEAVGRLVTRPTSA